MQTARKTDAGLAFIAKKTVVDGVVRLTIKERVKNGAVHVRTEEFKAPKFKNGAERKKFIDECAAKALAGAKSQPKPEQKAKPAEEQKPAPKGDA